ncbi:NADH oxidase [Streptomyces sp. NPDC002928]|uniref:NADH oxidase n=1 Tax=Streptomyces sp. NPDC002928 TaxID=3154440 RepID=UPI0033BDC008
MPDDVDGCTVDLWSLVEGVVVESGDLEGELVLTGPWGSERVSAPHPALEEALRRLELGPVRLANLEAGLEPEENGGRAPAADQGDGHYLLLHLERLSHLIVRTLGIDDLSGPLLSALPVSPVAHFALAPLPGRELVRLPGGVSFSVGRDGVSVQAPDASYRVQVHRPEVVWVLGLLVWPVTPDQASAALALPAGVTERILDYLAAAGMATKAEGDRPRPQILGRAGPRGSA